MRCTCPLLGVKRTLPWARPHLAFDPSGPPLFTLGYSLQANVILLHFLVATAILIAYRHGLRASELVALRWDGIDF
jgi:integrase